MQVLIFLLQYRTYIAQTPGSIHIAPLFGHAESVIASNLQTAPGTIPTGPFPAGTVGSIAIDGPIPAGLNLMKSSYSNLKTFF